MIYGVDEWLARAAEANRAGAAVVFAVLCKECGRALPRAGAGGVLIPGRMCECGPTVTERPAEMLRIHGLEGLLEAGRARLRSGGIEPVRD